MPLSNTRAMDQIHLLLQGLTAENNDDVFSEIIQIVRDTGRDLDGTDEETYLLLHMVDAHVAWSIPENRWVDVTQGTPFTGRDLTIPEESQGPDHAAFFFPVSEYRNLNDRAKTNLRTALYTIQQFIEQGNIYSWEWLAPEDRELPDMRVEVTWASTPTNPSSLTIQYTLAELNNLRLELTRVRPTRSSRVRLQEQWGSRVGDRLARREAQRSVAIPPNRREGVWTPGHDFDPQLTHPAFYEQGQDTPVMVVSHEDNEHHYVISRQGYARATTIDGDDEEMEIASPQEFRETFPDGNITWDMYDSPYYIIDRLDADGDVDNADTDGETYYDLSEAISRAANLLRVRPYDLNNREDLAA